MQLIIGILHLNTPNGATSYTVTVAAHLQRLGHDVCIFTADAGEMAAQSRARGLRVIEDARQLPDHPDGLLSNDPAIAYELCANRPHTPHVFVAHGAELDMGLPPQLPGTIDATIAMNQRVLRRLRAMAVDVEIVRLRQPIDTERFTARSPTRDEAMRVLLLGNYLRGPKRDMVVRACERAGLTWAQVGRDTALTTEPELAIADADIVIGYGRSVLEAMACGRAALILDQYVGDGWVTPDSYPALEDDGFRGTASGRVFDGAALESALGEYRAEMGALNRDLILQHHTAFTHADALGALFKRLAPDARNSSAPAAELSRLVRAQWHADWTAQEFTREVGVLRHRLADAESRADELALNIETLKSMRRYRLGAALARPLDWLRRKSKRERLTAPADHRPRALVPSALERGAVRSEGVRAVRRIEVRSSDG